jgi:transposase
MKPLSIDLRHRIVEAYEAGYGTKQQIANRFAVSVASVKKLVSQWQKLGTLVPQYQTVGRKPAFNQEQLFELDLLLERCCDITLAEIQEHFDGRVFCSHQAVANALKRLGWGYKKKRYMRLSRIEKTLS